jgi:hypothetical protein
MVFRSGLGTGARARRSLRGGLCLASLALWAGCFFFPDPPPDTAKTALQGRVLMASGVPLARAHVSIEQLELYADGGHKPGDVRGHVGDVYTDDRGYFDPFPGPRYGGLVLFRVLGGTFKDPISGARIQLDESVEMGAIYPLGLFEERAVTITPIHSMVAARFRYKMSLLPTPDPLVTLSDSYAHLNAHLGGLDWARVIPGDMNLPVDSPTEDLRAAFVLGGLAVLADDVRAASRATPQAVNLTTLIHAAEADLSDALLDGNDGNDLTAGSGLELGECPAPSTACNAQSTGCQLGTCRPFCSIYSNTWRTAWSQAVAAFLGTRAFPSVWNHTTIGAEDARPMLEKMARNDDPDLFGAACVEVTDRLAPAVGWEAPGDELTFVKGDLTVSISASDDSGSARAYFIDLADEDGDLTNNVARTTLHTRTLGDGPLTVTAAAIDKAGNERRVTRTFEIDNTAPVLALDGGGFYPDARAWWTATPAATLSGTLTEVHPKGISVTAGGTALPVVLSGAAWSVALPEGTISTSGTAVVVRAEDLAGNVTTTTQTLRLDDAPPTFAALPSIVKDERADTVGFIGVTPNHTHDGPAVTLGGMGCPDVYKYAYLLDANPPPFGGEIGSRNPLQWSFQLTDDGVGFDSNTAQVRVRVAGAGGAVLLDWTDAPERDTGPGVRRFDVPIYRNGAHGIAALGVTEGALEIDLRGHDRFGHEVSGTRCWTHHPLGAPVHLGAGFVPGTAGHVADPLALASHGLESSRIQDLAGLLLNTDTAVGASTMEAVVSNGTAEVVYLRVKLTAPPTANVSRGFSIAHDAASAMDIDESCDGAPAVCAPTPGLYTSPPEMLPAMTTSFELRLYTSNGELPIAEVAPCAEPGCVNTDTIRTYRLAARTGATAPSYAVVAWLKKASSLWPSNVAHPLSPPFSEFDQVGHRYTGRQADVDYCSRTVFRGIPRVQYCTQVTTYKRRQSLDKARIDINSTRVEAYTSIGPLAISIPTPSPSATSGIFMYETIEN